MANIDPQKLAASLVKAQQDIGNLMMSLKDISQDALLAGGDVSRVLTNNLNMCIENLEKLAQGQEQYSLKSLINYIGSLPLSTFYSTNLQTQISTVATTSQIQQSAPPVNLEPQVTNGPQSAIVNESSDYSLLNKYFKELKENDSTGSTPYKQQSQRISSQPVGSSNPYLYTESKRHLLGVSEEIRHGIEQIHEESGVSFGVGQGNNDLLDFNQLFESGVVSPVDINLESLRETAPRRGFNNHAVRNLMENTDYDIPQVSPFLEQAQENNMLLPPDLGIENQNEINETQEEPLQEVSLSDWRNIGLPFSEETFDDDGTFGIFREDGYEPDSDIQVN